MIFLIVVGDLSSILCFDAVRWVKAGSPACNNPARKENQRLIESSVVRDSAQAGVIAEDRLSNKSSAAAETADRGKKQTWT